MTEVARVLIVGKNAAQAEGMARVLRHCWIVRTALVRAALVRAGGEPKLDAEVVVLCDEFTEVERQHLVDHVKAEMPGILIVKMNGYASGPHAGADATVDEEQGPAALISTIYELLCERGMGSHRWADAYANAWLQ